VNNVLSIGNPKRGVLYSELLEVIQKHNDLRLEDIVGVLEILKMDYYKWSQDEYNV